MNKCLAESNKSPHQAQATKKRNIPGGFFLKPSNYWADEPIEDQDVTLSVVHVQTDAMRGLSALSDAGARGTEAVLGMIRKVGHLVECEEASE